MTKLSLFLKIIFHEKILACILIDLMFTALILFNNAVNFLGFVPVVLVTVVFDIDSETLN